MAELVTWVNEERKTAQLHPLPIAAIFVVVFLEIHPFQDGNGRLSRVLATLLFIQAGDADVPYRSLESVIDLDKDAYLLSCSAPDAGVDTIGRTQLATVLGSLPSLAGRAARATGKEGRARENRFGRSA